MAPHPALYALFLAPLLACAPTHPSLRTAPNPPSPALQAALLQVEQIKEWTGMYPGEAAHRDSAGTLSPGPGHLRLSYLYGDLITVVGVVESTSNTSQPSVLGMGPFEIPVDSAERLQGSVTARRKRFAYDLRRQEDTVKGVFIVADLATNALERFSFNGTFNGGCCYTGTRQEWGLCPVIDPELLAEEPPE